LKAILENNINGKKPKNVIHDGAGVNSNGFYIDIFLISIKSYS
jgi:hypothetical protein